MKVTIGDGRTFDFFVHGDEEFEPRKMTMDELEETLKNVIDEREGIENDMDDWGLVLDEVYLDLQNEIRRRKDIPRLNNFFLEKIIDGLEDWLSEKGVEIPNEDRDREDPDSDAQIYGEDFDRIMEMIRGVCREHEIVVEDDWDD